MSNNPFILPNVVLDPNYVDMDKAKVCCGRSVLAETVWLCATKYPLWKFQATYVSTVGYVSMFRVYNNGELLGSIEAVQVPTSGAWAVAVENHRISNARARGKAFRTTTPKNAFDKVRKTFGRKNATERLADAEAKTKTVLRDVSYETQNRFGQADEKHVRALIAFAKLPNIYEQFLSYAEHNEAAAKVVAELEDTKVAMQTMNDVRAKYGKPDSVLVIVDDGEYIVRYTDHVKIFDDGTMPYNVRAKLGMLKLVEPGKAIDQFGFRVSEDVYVVLMGNDDGAKHE